MSGNEVIRKISLKKGYEMLSDGYNVSETAYACGFDPSYFRNCFKAEYGVFPSEFVKSRNKPSNKGEGPRPPPLLLNTSYLIL